MCCTKYTAIEDVDQNLNQSYSNTNHFNMTMSPKVMPGGVRSLGGWMVMTRAYDIWVSGGCLCVDVWIY